MTTTIIGALVAVLGGVGSYFTWKASSVRQRKIAEADVRNEEALFEAHKQDIRRAVYENNDEELNRIVKRLMED